LDGGEFPPSLGSYYATVRKTYSDGPLDWTKYKYLDAIHMDIAYGDCLLVGGFCYVLILVDQATRCNWAFGLKNLSSDTILSAIQLFHSSAGSLPRSSTAIVTSNSLALQSGNISLTTSPRWLPPQQMAIVPWVT
jgi:hypothetical protein